jgi:hypothetical protein
LRNCAPACTQRGCDDHHAKALTHVQHHQDWLYRACSRARVVTGPSQFQRTSDCRSLRHSDHCAVAPPCAAAMAASRSLAASAFLWS